MQPIVTYFCVASSNIMTPPVSEMPHTQCKPGAGKVLDQVQDS
jgi:hypothetical protein